MIAAPEERNEEMSKMRRNDILRATPAEKAISDAIAAVEALGANVLLTDAVVMLSEARHRVSDFVDGTEPPLRTDEAERAMPLVQYLHECAEAFVRRSPDLAHGVTFAANRIVDWSKGKVETTPPGDWTIGLPGNDGGTKI